MKQFCCCQKINVLLFKKKTTKKICTYMLINRSIWILLAPLKIPIYHHITVSSAKAFINSILRQKITINMYVLFFFIYFVFEIRWRHICWPCLVLDFKLFRIVRQRTVVSRVNFVSNSNKQTMVEWNERERIDHWKVGSFSWLVLEMWQISCITVLTHAQFIELCIFDPN